MDGYLYNLDPHRQAAAGYYAPRYPSSYALERRSSYGLPSADPFAGYGAPYQPDTLLPRYVSAPASSPYRHRPPRTMPTRKGSPPQRLGPKKKPFKQTQKVRFSEEKVRPSTKQDTAQPANKSVKAYAKAAPASQAASLAKETQELHSLFRTGVDTNKVEKSEGKKGDANGTAKKRKADSQVQKPTPTKNARNAKKGKKKKKKKKPSNDNKAVVKAEEEIKGLEAALEMQRGLCKKVMEFLGIPELNESGVADAVQSDGKVEESKETEKDTTETDKGSKEIEHDTMETDKDSMETDKGCKETDKDSTKTEKKPEEPQQTPEEEKEVEASSFKFFSSLFAENQELRDLYVDKCNAGSFECLVCRSVDAARSKTFWNLVSLVIHTKMRKQMRPEHAGYGHAISSVLGWDHENIPKVPRGHIRPAVLKKSADQGKDVTKREKAVKEVPEQEQKEVESMVKEVPELDQKEVETIAKEVKEGENHSEPPSEDAKEE
ncbi:hypothetical protein GOP47_0003452 [Adiantum capillus-veneris]|uniref:Uncharacterized protein n=1 Tax=Adiantum capillus-veneris TaxID=13818 RepID=A0A9D4ZQ30_ADICA|nr:hypothetical protein GOP47_0002899 [Adiantum capillus-veneris]KAI5083709.1 hypothetical protein GOP47_0003452 [Adiantum capillus-veneris]